MIRELYEKATGGEWSYEPEDYSRDRIRCGKELIAEMVGDSAITEARAALIVALHNCGREMLAAVEAAEKVVIHYLGDNWRDAEFKEGYEHPLKDLIVFLRSFREKEGRL